MTVGLAPFSLGFIIAIVVLILAVIGIVGVLPMTPVTIFGLVAALAIARLC
ncbi:MAG TPA: hypothetical protein VFB50_04155 [Chloroflexota bacterium]|nr:hypothetical protein [Chloroflexota bacterium]